MGAPDLLGTYGPFSFCTSDPSPSPARRLSGGVAYNVRVHDGRVRASLEGPDDPLLRAPAKV